MFFDLLGSLVSLISTYYFIRLNNKAWPIGIIATVLNGWLYWHKGIYADMLLEFFYFLSMCYGWHKWQKNSSEDTISPQTSLTYLKPLQWISLCLLFCFVFTVIHYLLQTLTHSNVALLDAITTSLSLVAQWLMCHKIIITWLLWFITDALYALMYQSKSLPFHSILMIVYMSMAIAGYWIWSRQYKKVITILPQPTTIPSQVA